VEQAQYHVVHGVDTRRHSGNSRTFLFQTAYILVSAYWLRPQCSRAPENWRFECPPTLETGCAPMWESNNKHRAVPMQVTTESDEAESTLAGRKQPRGSSHQKIGVPGAWHSQQTHPAQITTLTRILTVRRVGGAGNLKLPTQRCGAVGFLRVHAEEDVNY